MKRRWSMSIAVAVVLVTLCSSSVFAFDDLSDGADKNMILSLKERGIVNGNGSSFMAQKPLTHAAGIQMIVKGLDLNLNAFLFVKEPLASDSFDSVEDDAWYAKAMVTAVMNGLDLDRSIDPEGKMTKQEFVHHLFTAMMLKGDYPFTKRLFVLADEKDVSPDYMHSIQLMLNARIVELEDTGNFEPTKVLTRREAAVLLYRTIEFVERYTVEVQDDEVMIEEQVSFEDVIVNEDVDKVILRWGEKPNTGYSIAITSIKFDDDRKACIYYRLDYPKKGYSYAEVITHPEASTFVPAGTAVEIVQEK